MSDKNKPGEERKYVTPKQLLDWGLIFEINRLVLHPLGLALALTKDEATGKFVFSNDVWDYRDDPEGILFAGDTFKIGADKLEAMLEEWGYQKHMDRAEKVGYIVQGKTDHVEDSLKAVSRLVQKVNKEVDSEDSEE